MSMSKAAPAFHPTPAGCLGKLKIRRQPTGLKVIDAKRPPPELSPIALEEWKRIVPHLAEASLAAVVDANVLATYCEVRARWIAAEKMVAELGPVVASSTQTPTSNPYLKVADTAIRQLTELGRELGLSPAARGELGKRS